MRTSSEPRCQFLPRIIHEQGHQPELGAREEKRAEDRGLQGINMQEADTGSENDEIGTG